MFSLQIKTIFRVLGEALLTLANMPASAIDTLDRPDVGGDVARLEANNFGNSPASVVFAVPTGATSVTLNGVGVGTGGGGVLSVLAVPEPLVEVEYEMVAGYPHTREQMNTAGWTDDALIAAGHLVAVAPPKPIAPPVTAPPPPPAPVAPPSPSAAAVAPPPTAPSGAQSASAVDPAMVDSEGVVYDARIHAQTKTKTQAGAWKKGKGVDPDLIAQVVAQQKAGGVAPAPAPFVPLNAAPPPPAPGATASVNASATVAPPPPAAGATTLTPPTTFVDLCKWNNAKGIQKPRLDEVCNALGVPGGFPGLARPENTQMIPNVYAMLNTK